MTLRPMVTEDQEALLAFFQRIPADDRLYLRDDVISPERISPVVVPLSVTAE